MIPEDSLSFLLAVGPLYFNMEVIKQAIDGI